MYGDTPPNTYINGSLCTFFSTEYCFMMLLHAITPLQFPLRLLIHLLSRMYVSTYMCILVTYLSLLFKVHTYVHIQENAHCTCMYCITHSTYLLMDTCMFACAYPNIRIMGIHRALRLRCLNRTFTMNQWQWRKLFQAAKWCVQYTM